jgi:hypothetical protein
VVALESIKATWSVSGWRRNASGAVVPFSRLDYV